MATGGCGNTDVTSTAAGTAVSDTAVDGDDKHNSAPSAFSVIVVDSAADKDLGNAVDRRSLSNVAVSAPSVVSSDVHVDSQVSGVAQGEGGPDGDSRADVGGAPPAVARELASAFASESGEAVSRVSEKKQANKGGSVQADAGCAPPVLRTRWMEVLSDSSWVNEAKAFFRMINEGENGFITKKHFVTMARACVTNPPPLPMRWD